MELRKIPGLLLLSLSTPAWAFAGAGAIRGGDSAAQEISFGKRLSLIDAETGVTQAMPFPVDMNGDGLLDLLVGVKIKNADGSYTGKVRVYANKGTAVKPAYKGFTYLTVNGVELTEEQTAGGCQGLQAQFGDFNGDGYRDLAVGHIAGAIEVYPGTAQAGIYGEPIQLLEDADAGSRYRTYVTFYDSDCDGCDELFTGYMGGEFTKFDYDKLTGSWTATDVTDALGVELQIPKQSQESNRRTTPAFADVDGDGFADLLSGSTDGNVYMFPSVSRGEWESDCSCIVKGQENMERSRISVGDLNGDGIVDLVVGYNDGHVSWYEGTRDESGISLSLDGQELEEGEPFPVSVDCGVAIDWAVVVTASSPTTVKATGLPSGVKLVKNKTTGELSLTGVPKKASAKPSTIRLTVTAADKTKKIYTVEMTVRARDGWAVGTYMGPVDGELGRGTVTVKVAANGTVSGKYVVGTKSYSLSAASLAGVTEDGDFLADVKVKVPGRGTVVDTISIGSRVFDSSMPDTGAVNTDVSETGITMADVVQDLWSRTDKASFRLPVFASGASVEYEFADGDDSGALVFRFGAKGKVTVKGKVNGKSVSGSTQLLLDDVGPSSCMCFEKSYNGRIVVSFPKAGFCRTFSFSADYLVGKISEYDIVLDILPVQQ